MVVRQDGYDDVTTPPQLLPGAREGLAALKAAGHTLVLWSARASPALRRGPEADPLVRAGKRKVHAAQWQKEQPLHEARYRQMVKFVEAQLPGVFDAIDDGAAGKLPGVDLFLDDRAVRFGTGPGALSWRDVARLYGDRVTPPARSGMIPPAGASRARGSDVRPPRRPA